MVVQVRARDESGYDWNPENRIYMAYRLVLTGGDIQAPIRCKLAERIVSQNIRGGVSSKQGNSHQKM